jgi:acyl carrier protein
MTEDEIRAALAKILARIAPEADLASIDPREPLQRALDIDSFDFLNLLTSIRDALGVSIAESEYGKVATLQGLVRLLASRPPNRSRAD